MRVYGKQRNNLANVSNWLLYIYIGNNMITLHFYIMGF